MSSIKGDRGRLKVFENGKDLQILSITGFEVTEDSQFLKSNYVGKSVPETDKTFDGYSGSIDTEVKSAVQDLLIDRINSAIKRGIGMPRIALVLSEDYPDGTSKSYIYTNVQLKLSRSQKGGTEKVTKRFEFNASDRKPI